MLGFHLYTKTKMHMRKLYLLLLGVVFFATQAMAQRTITGMVTDEKGNPVANASVMVRGTTVGTTTKADGTFTLMPGQSSFPRLT